MSCLFQEIIILIVDIIFQIIMFGTYIRLESITLTFQLMEFFFFNWPVKNEEQAFEKIIDNNGYTTGNLLDYAYCKKTLQTNCN